KIIQIKSAPSAISSQETHLRDTTLTSAKPHGPALNRFILKPWRDNRRLLQGAQDSPLVCSKTIFTTFAIASFHLPWLSLKSLE
ncbi:hypothetical protein, partial [Lactobacillus sp.]|uniref:hypothetical protein n=1 Tax=Lactobacillus sp. TaxID=1591 RepID=UPI003EF4BB87